MKITMLDMAGSQREKSTNIHFSILLPASISPLLEFDFNYLLTENNLSLFID